MKRNFVFTDDFAKLSIGAYLFDSFRLFAVYEYRFTHELVFEPLAWISDFSELRKYASEQLSKIRSQRMRRKYSSFRVVLKLWDGYCVTLFFA